MTIGGAQVGIVTVAHVEVVEIIQQGLALVALQAPPVLPVSRAAPAASLSRISGVTSSPWLSSTAMTKSSSRPPHGAKMAVTLQLVQHVGVVL